MISATELNAEYTTAIKEKASKMDSILKPIYSKIEEDLHEAAKNGIDHVRYYNLHSLFSSNIPNYDKEYSIDLENRLIQVLKNQGFSVDGYSHENLYISGWDSIEKEKEYYRYYYY